MTNEARPQTMALPRAPKSEPGTRVGKLHGKGAWYFAGLILLLAAGALFWRTTHGAPAARYISVGAARGDITRSAAATGTVNPELTIIVGSYVSGMHPVAVLRLQHQGKSRSDLRQDRSPPLPDGRRPGQGQSGGSQGAARQGSSQPGLHRLRLANAIALLLRQDSVSQDAADHAKNHRRPGRGADRLRSAPRSTSARPSLTPPMSISTTPISSRPWTARWCRAT